MVRCSSRTDLIPRITRMSRASRKNRKKPIAGTEAAKVEQAPTEEVFHLVRRNHQIAHEVEEEDHADSQVEVGKEAKHLRLLIQNEQADHDDQRENRDQRDEQVIHHRIITNIHRFDVVEIHRSSRIMNRSGRLPKRPAKQIFRDDRHRPNNCQVPPKRFRVPSRSDVE